MAQHFYDGQIRRYITQLVRLMSNFSYKDSKERLVQIPVMYGDITRQVGSILKEGSENKIPSAPRMGIYVTGIEMNTAMLADASYISKVNVRERAYDSTGKEYLNESGKNYTVERLMPTPYELSVNVDIWTTNTDQKLQVLEQILMLFNPSLEIQTTDNYIDWTSLSVVNLDGITWTGRTIPVGIDSDIDVATLAFKTPIYISPPVKVKRLGVITNIITSIFDETGNINNINPTKLFDTFGNQLAAELSSDFDSNDSLQPELATETTDVHGRIVVAPTGEVTNIAQSGKVKRGSADIVMGISHNNHNLLVLNGVLQLVYKGIVGNIAWKTYLDEIPGNFQAGLSQIRLSRQDLTTEIIGSFAIDPADPSKSVVNWDEDSLPSDTIIASTLQSKAKIDYILDPTKTNPTTLKTTGNRILLLGAIGSSLNTDGADAWKNADGTDFIASANDIVEWNGTKWIVVFDASNKTDPLTDITYTTNLNTSVQYKWDAFEWVLSFEGEYPDGTWRIVF
jgi:hypothetical protein